MQRPDRQHSHGIVLEELLELPLSGRIREVPNVQPTTFIGTGGGRICVSSRRRGAVGIVNSGGSQVVGEVVDGRRHVDG